MDPNTMRRYLDASIREAVYRANRCIAQLEGRAATQRQQAVVRRAELILELAATFRAKSN